LAVFAVPIDERTVCRKSGAGRRPLKDASTLWREAPDMVGGGGRYILVFSGTNRDIALRRAPGAGLREDLILCPVPSLTLKSGMRCL
jgi:hypothetical protein